MKKTDWNDDRTKVPAAKDKGHQTLHRNITVEAQLDSVNAAVAATKH